MKTEAKQSIKVFKFVHDKTAKKGSLEEISFERKWNYKIFQTKSFYGDREREGHFPWNKKSSNWKQMPFVTCHHIQQQKKDERAIKKKEVLVKKYQIKPQHISWNIS